MYLQIFAGYVDLILKETVQLRSKYNTFKKAKVYSNEVLPDKPRSLVEQYLEGVERPSKEQVVASQNSIQQTSFTKKLKQ